MSAPNAIQRPVSVPTVDNSLEGIFRQVFAGSETLHRQRGPSFSSHPSKAPRSEHGNQANQHRTAHPNTPAPSSPSPSAHVPPPTHPHGVKTAALGHSRFGPTRRHQVVALLTVPSKNATVIDTLSVLLTVALMSNGIDRVCSMNRLDWCISH